MMFFVLQEQKMIVIFVLQIYNVTAVINPCKRYVIYVLDL